jgi:RNA polymerase sigma-70 factor (ECF subfamily)
VPDHDEEIAGRIDAVVASALAAWPRFGVTPDAFRDYVVARLTSPADVDALHAADLYLACACVAGDDEALRVLDSGWLRPLEQSLRRVATTAAADALQALREKLLVRGKLADYAGRGPLASWLRVAGVRTALNLCRGQPAGSVDHELATLADGGRDIELDYIQARFRSEFKQAFGAAVATLTQRQRGLLGFHYVEALTLEQVAAVYRVSRATVARWLAEARQRLLAETRRQLAETLELDTAQLDSMMQLLDSHIDVSLSAIAPKR